MANDLGNQIPAARAYAGISRSTLADSISVSTHALQRIEAGLEEYGESERWALIHAITLATRLPEQFFTVDFAQLEREESPESRIAQYEALIERSLDELARLLEPRQDDKERAGE
ncbi:MAG TPA: hypothetical protein VK733_03545 [Gemmatimonadaceae bacterium]|jgi:DNA-binding XRE family transcriptional regulator|nr:hypothetical protein [Gemmatimonadaceae bacterium]